MYPVVYGAVPDVCVAADFAVACVVVQLIDQSATGIGAEVVACQIVQTRAEAGGAQAAETAAEADEVAVAYGGLVAGKVKTEAGAGGQVSDIGMVVI